MDLLDFQGLLGLEEMEGSVIFFISCIYSLINF